MTDTAADVLTPIEDTPENRRLAFAVFGPVENDWSNAVLLGHPVYLVNGTHLRGSVPEVSPLTGRIKTVNDDEGRERIVSRLRDFPIPDGHPWKATPR